jgi:hypothetical protein
VQSKSAGAAIKRDGKFQRRKLAAGTLFSLIAAFKTSSEFTGISSERAKRTTGATSK